MIRLVATDIDGTLFTEGRGYLDTDFIDVVRKLRKKGIRFVIASGRGYESIARVFEPLIDDVIILAENGGYAREGDRVLFTKAYERDIFMEALDYVRGFNPRFLMTASCLDNYTESKEEAFIQKLEEGYHVIWKRVDDLKQYWQDDFLKIALYLYEDSQKTASIMKEHFGNRLCVMATGTYWIDLVPYGVDKGWGLSNVQKQLGISREETIAFGDNGNDIAMLKRAVESYAVSNAREEVKKVAAHVIGDCRDGAVTAVLQELLRNIGS